MSVSFIYFVHFLSFCSVALIMSVQCFLELVIVIFFLLGVSWNIVFFTFFFFIRLLKPLLFRPINICTTKTHCLNVRKGPGSVLYQDQEPLKKCHPHRMKYVLLLSSLSTDLNICLDCMTNRLNVFIRLCLSYSILSSVIWFCIEVDGVAWRIFGIFTQRMGQSVWASNQITKIDSQT